MSRKLLFLMSALAILSGCAHPISETLRQQTDATLTLSEVQKFPEKHVGKKMILGGNIIQTRNLDQNTEIEVIQKPLDSFGYPQDSDYSEGRFLLRKPGYLESEIFSKGRRVTGAGTVVGVKTGKVDDVDYHYPVIEIEELKLWERENPAYYRPFWGDPYYGPYSAFYWGPYPRYPFRYYGHFGRPYYW